MNQIESQRRIFRNIRHMEGKLKCGYTSKVITTIDGREVEFTEKEDIESICVGENERKYHQIELGDRQLLSHEFIHDLDHYGEGLQSTKCLTLSRLYVGILYADKFKKIA